MRVNSRQLERSSEFIIWRFLSHNTFMILRLHEKELAKFKLTPEQAKVLDILVANGGGTTINTIVKWTLRQHHSISTQLDRMEKRGLVHRIRSKEDKRKYDVHLTEEGQRLFNQLRNDSITEVISTLSDKEQAEFLKLLRKVWARANDLTSESEGTHTNNNQLQSSDES